MQKQEAYHNEISSKDKSLKSKSVRYPFNRSKADSNSQ